MRLIDTVPTTRVTVPSFLRDKPNGKRCPRCRSRRLTRTSASPICRQCARGLPTDERLFVAVTPGPLDTPCWIALLTPNADTGYPRIHADGRIVGTHRWAWEYANGRPICDVRMCVNPDHLYIGTHLDNARDRESRGRHGVRRAS